MISKDRILMQQQVYNFLRSLTLKMEFIAEYQNTTLVKKGYAVNFQDPQSWKYYTNMLGRYHISDTLMYVTSLDTHDRILFSPEVLQDHPRTKSVYMPGGLYYRRLCETYPDQVDLIKSILFPVESFEKAYKAEEFSILAYGSGYLEPWEESPIIMELRKTLDIYRERWYFDFLKDEPYFHVTTISTLTAILAACIMTAREGFVKTAYVHSFHLWNYLISHGIDDYSDVLDREKSLMLYQNIEYLKANAGKQSNLIILANGLLSGFSVSLYGRRVVQEAETNASTYELVPQLEAFKIPTSTAAITTEIASETVESIQAKVFEKGFAIDDSTASSLIKERVLSDTTLNEYSTKFLEIRPLTKNKMYADTLSMFLIETLMVSVTQGYYNTPVNVTDPATGVNLYLYPKELLAIYHYAVHRSLGRTPVNIPTKFEMFKAFNTTIGTPAKTIMYGEQKLYLSHHVDSAAYLTDLNYKTNLSDPDDFTEMLTRLWLRYMDHLLKDQNTKVDRIHYCYRYLSSLCHTRKFKTMNLVPGFTTYEDWFGINGIDIASSIVAQYDAQVNSADVWGSLADSITTALVPINDILESFGNFTLSDFGYTRLRQLFTQMCSYNVVFLESARDTPIYVGQVKDSVDYAEIEADTFGDNIVSLNVDIVTQVNSPTDVSPHQGFHENITNKADVFSNYTVTPVIEFGATYAESAAEPQIVNAITFGVTMSQGVINLPYTQTIPEGIAITEEDAFLIDSDGSRLLDDDGSFLNDPI